MGSNLGNTRFAIYFYDICDYNYHIRCDLSTAYYSLKIYVYPYWEPFWLFLRLGTLF